MSAQSPAPSRLEWAYAAVALGLISGAGLDAVRATLKISAETPHPMNQALFVLHLVAMLPAALLALRRRSEVLRVARSNALLWLAAALALASASWSVLPARSLGLAGHLIAALIFATWLAVRFEPAQLLSLTALVGAVLVVACFAFVFALPEYGRAHEPWMHHTWQGAFSNKNALGQVGGVAALSGALAAASGVVRRRWGVPLAAGGFALLLAARSMNALLALAAAIAFAAAARHLAVRGARWRAALAPVLLAAVLGSPLAVFWGAGVAGRWLARDSTLTGRTLLWTHSWARVLERPLAGYGYLAFWRDEALAGPIDRAVAADAGFEFDPRYSWFCPHAHNGLLEVALSVGLLGAALVAAWLALGGAAAALAASADPASLWPAALWAFVTVLGVGEVPWLRSLHNEGLLFLLLVATLGGLARKKA